MSGDSDEKLLAAMEAAKKAVEENVDDAKKKALLQAFVSAQTKWYQFQRAKFNFRAGEERLIDDAFCLVPFISGAFRENGARNFYMVSPFLRLYTPKIDVKTGSWRIFTERSLRDCTKAMNICNLSWHDSLNGHTFVEKTIEFIPLAKILKSVQKIENNIILSLTRNKLTIASNAREIRSLIIENAARLYHNADIEDKNTHFGILWDFIAGANKIKDSKSKHPFEFVTHADNQPFQCVYDLRTFLDEKFNGMRLKEDVREKILAQESHRIGNIIASMNAYKKMYSKFMDCIQGKETVVNEKVTAYDSKTLTKNDLKNTLYETKHLTDSEESVVNKALDNVIQALLIERFELLSCHVHTFFSVCIGTGDEVHDLAQNFVDDAIKFCMADFFRTVQKEIKVKNGDALSYKQWVQKMDEGKARLTDSSSKETKEKMDKFEIIRSLGDWKEIFQGIMKSVFETFNPVDLKQTKGPNSDYAAMSRMISSTFVSQPATPEQLTSKCFPYTVFNKTSLDRINQIVSIGEATNGRIRFKDLLGNKPGRRICLSDFCYDPVRDAALDFINKKMTAVDNPSHRYSFEIAKQVLYANHHDVPLFVSMHLFDEVSESDRTIQAKQYLHDINIPIVTGSKPLDSYTGPKVHTIVWDTIPFSYSTMALKLNYSALAQPATSTTQPPARKAKQQKKNKSTQKKKGESTSTSKPSTAPNRSSTTKKSTLEFGKEKSGTLTIHKKKQVKVAKKK
jgi:hypothetical protein